MSTPTSAGTGGTSQYLPKPMDWCLGRTNPKKVVHHSNCRHARRPYEWARQFETIEQLALALVDPTYGQAWRWHHFCQACCGDLDDAVAAVLRDVARG